MIFCSDIILRSTFKVLHKDDKESMELCSTMLQRGQCPPLLVVFDSRYGYFLEFKVLTYLVFEIFSVNYSKFIDLYLKVAIDVYAAGIFVCATSLDLPVSHTYTHKRAKTQISVDICKSG